MAVLTYRELQKIFWQQAVNISQIEPSRVAHAYEQDSQPYLDPNSAWLYLFVGIAPNTYDKQTDIEYGQNNDETVEETASYTRVISVDFYCFGPESFDIADKLIHGMFRPLVTSVFNASGIFPVVHPETPTHAPYPWNGQWWSRTDFKIDFYTYNTRITEIPFFLSGQISVIGDDGSSRTIVQVEPDWVFLFDSVDGSQYIPLL